MEMPPCGLVVDSRSVDSFGYLVGEGLHFIGCHFDVVVEVEVGLGLHGHKVDVGMRHLQPQHGDAYFDAGTGFFQSFGNAVGEALQLAVEFFVEVEDVVNLLFGDAQDVAFHHGVDIEEGKAVVGFGNFVAGYFAGYDS